MISKVAKSLALREAFPQELNGLSTAEEMPENFAPKEALPEPTVEPKQEPKKQTKEDIKDFSKYYSYNLAAASKAIPQAERKGVWETLVQVYGVFKQNGAALCEREIPEWAEYLIEAPKQETKFQTAFGLGEPDDFDRPDDLPGVREQKRLIEQYGLKGA